MTLRRVTGIGLFLWLALGGTASARGARTRCSQREAMAAEEEAASLHTWEKLFRSYQRYRHCDDGAIGEGYSESVSVLLADHWSYLPQAVELLKSHPAFERFVLRHVDLTVPDERLDAIRDNALRLCPRVGAPFCRKLLEQLRKVDAEAESERRAAPH